jgi:hypothetical protein
MRFIYFISIFLFITSCNQNRDNEYVCNPITKGFKKSLSLKISKDKVKSVTQGAPEYTYAILEEKYDRIVFGYKNLVGKGQTERVFYKKTLKYKWASISNKNSLIAVYQCQKMN